MGRTTTKCLNSAMSAKNLSQPAAVTGKAAPAIQKPISREALAILAVEDDANDALLLKLAFAKAGVTAPIHFVGDGIEALDYLRGAPPFGERAEHPPPNLLVLDLKMPRADGFEVLAWIRQRPGRERMTIAVLTGSCSQADIERAYGLGANFCLNKRLDFRQLVDVAKGLVARCAMPLLPASADLESNTPRHIPQAGQGGQGG